MADFLGAVLSDAEPPAPVETIPPQPMAQPAPTEQPAPIAPEKPQEPVIEAALQKPEAGHIPISALMDERDKRKAAEARLAAFEASQQPVAHPDPLDDPEGYNAYLNSQLEGRLAQERAGMSNVMAVQAHGEEAVKSAVGWANERVQSDPVFLLAWQHAFKHEPHPIDWVVRQHQRDAMVSGLGTVSSLDDWFQQEAAKRGYVSQSAPVAAAPIAAVPPVPRPAAPPVSIASEAPASAPAHNDVAADFLGSILRK